MERSQNYHFRSDRPSRSDHGCPFRRFSVSTERMCGCDLADDLDCDVLLSVGIRKPSARRHGAAGSTFSKTAIQSEDGPMMFASRRHSEVGQFFLAFTCGLRAIAVIKRFHRAAQRGFRRFQPIRRDFPVARSARSRLRNRPLQGLTVLVTFFIHRVLNSPHHPCGGICGRNIDARRRPASKQPSSSTSTRRRRHQYLLARGPRMSRMDFEKYRAPEMREARW